MDTNIEQIMQILRTRQEEAIVAELSRMALLGIEFKLGDEQVPKTKVPDWADLEVDIRYRSTDPDGPAKAMFARNYIAAAPEMWALLKKLEWSKRVCMTLEPSGMQYWSDGCPVCDSHTKGDHTLDCRLAAVLKAVEGEV